MHVLRQAIWGDIWKHTVEKVWQMQPVWRCILSCKDTFANTQWRKTKQMQPVWLGWQFDIYKILWKEFVISGSPFIGYILMFHISQQSLVFLPFCHTVHIQIAFPPKNLELVFATVCVCCLLWEPYWCTVGAHGNGGCSFTVQLCCFTPTAEMINAPLMPLFVISLLIDSLHTMYLLHVHCGAIHATKLCCVAPNCGGKGQFWGRQGNIVFKFCRIIKDSKGLLAGKKWKTQPQQWR